MIYLQLFFSFFQIGLFSVGGGYASLPIIQDIIVENHAWITASQFSDVLTISQMTPGPIAINAATFVGIQIAGLPGAVVAVLGFVLPSLLIVMTLVLVYYKFKNLSIVDNIFDYLQPAVVALIISAALSIIVTAFYGTEGFALGIQSIDFIAVAIFAVALFVLRKFKMQPIVVMLASALIGIVAYQLVGV